MKINVKRGFFSTALSIEGDIQELSFFFGTKISDKIMEKRLI